MLNHSTDSGTGPAVRTSNTHATEDCTLKLTHYSKNSVSNKKDDEYSFWSKAIEQKIPVLINGLRSVDTTETPHPGHEHTGLLDSEGNTVSTPLTAVLSARAEAIPKSLPRRFLGRRTCRHCGYPGRVLFCSTRVLKNSTQPPTRVCDPIRSKNTALGVFRTPGGVCWGPVLSFSSCRLGHFLSNGDPRHWPFGVWGFYSKAAFVAWWPTISV